MLSCFEFKSSSAFKPFPLSSSPPCAFAVHVEISDEEKKYSFIISCVCHLGLTDSSLLLWSSPLFVLLSFIAMLLFPFDGVGSEKNGFSADALPHPLLFLPPLPFFFFFFVSSSDGDFSGSSLHVHHLLSPSCPSSLSLRSPSSSTGHLRSYKSCVDAVYLVKAVFCVVVLSWTNSVILSHFSLSLCHSLSQSVRERMRTCACECV